jgi:hypothetical protein
MRRRNDQAVPGSAVDSQPGIGNKDKRQTAECYTRCAPATHGNK